jgi:hypothetical protein
MQDNSPRTDLGLMFSVIAVVVGTLGYHFAQALTSKDQQIRTLESQVSNLQGQLTGYSQGRH